MRSLSQRKSNGVLAATISKMKVLACRTISVNGSVNSVPAGALVWVAAVATELAAIYMGNLPVESPKDSTPTPNSSSKVKCKLVKGVFSG